MKKKIASPLIEVAVSYAAESCPSMNEETQQKVKDLFIKFISGVLSYDDAFNLIEKYIGTHEPLDKIQAILSVPPTPLNEFSSKNEKYSIPRQRSHPWTSMEDKRLLAAIHQNGPSDWAQIAIFVGNGRTRSQCSQRWHRTLDPHISKERWSDNDDYKLLQAVHKYGQSSWTKVAQEIGGRTDVQCRYRFQLIEKRKQIGKQSRQMLNSYNMKDSDEEYVEITGSDSLSSSVPSPAPPKEKKEVTLPSANSDPQVNKSTIDLPIFSEPDEHLTKINPNNDEKSPNFYAIWQFLFSENAYHECTNDYDLMF